MIYSARNSSSVRMNDRYFLVLLIGALLLSWQVSGGNSQSAHYWVRPDTMEECPENISSQACFTISELVSTSNVTIAFAPNTTIHFLSGEHTPDTSGWIESGNQVKHLYIVGEVDHYCSPPAECNVVINCTHAKIVFAFISLTTVSMVHIDISHCGFFIHDLVQIRNTTNQLDCRLSETIQPRASIVIANTTEMMLSNIVVDNSSGYGLLTLLQTIPSCVDKIVINIVNSTFQYSNWTPLGNSLTSGGNIAILIKHHPSREDWPIVEISIINVSVLHGSGFKCSEHIAVNAISAQSHHTGGGLTIYGTSHPVKGYIAIDNCTFEDNQAYVGGGLNIILKQQWGIASLNISNCQVHNNRVQSKGGGLYIQVELLVNSSKTTPYKYFNMKNTHFSSNVAVKSGGAVYVQSFLHTTTTHPGYNVQYSIEENCTFHKNRAEKGAALYIRVFTHTLIICNTVETNKNKSPFVITTSIRDAHFVNNEASNGGALYILSIDSNPDIHVNVLRCYFFRNSGVKGAALYAADKSILKESSGNLFSIKTSILLQNNAPAEDTGQKAGAVIYIDKFELNLEDSRIKSHNLRGIYANISDIKIRGQVWVVNNSAMGNAAYGGGIYLDDSWRIYSQEWCQIIVEENSTLYLIGNTATYFGGAIAIPDSGNILKTCFFQSNVRVPESAAIVTKDNFAGTAGSAIFGGALETCTIHIEQNNTKVELSKEYFWSFFTILENETLSTIASIPFKVCVCNNQTHSIDSCNKHHRLSTFPGKLFHIPLIGVGHWNYPAPSVIRARLETRNAKIEEEWTTQDFGLECRNASFVINTQLEDEEVVMTLVIETTYIQDSLLPTLEPAEVLIHILKCPYGFILNTTTNSCNCTDHLNKAGVQCNIDTQRIHKHQYTWIGNFSDEVIVYNHCPFSYCKKYYLKVDPYNQQEQCNGNGSGVLCGACRPGLSRVLGTSQCEKCSNIYLLLLIPFALAGVALVVLLLKCNLTVSTGTINGLIFYANIVHDNRSILFPPNPQSTLVYILSVLIAWLNLDLGIETCFAENLNMYTIIWLEFVFPIYIWLIVGILILVSHYSTTVSRLTGSNTVSVLATLFLLSYAKLLRTTFRSFNSTILTNSDGNESKVWLLDGNISFLQWPHALLFTAAFIMLVIHILPFTALLLFSPLILKYSHIRVFCWAAKLMPLLDAYHGPYKHKYRYWTGLMLLLRLILFIAFSSNVLGDPHINHLVIVISITILLGIWIKVGRIYRNKVINCLELFFLFNLLLLAVSSTHLTSSNTVTSGNESSKYILLLLLVAMGSAVAVFVCILVYHCFEVVKHIGVIKKLIEKIKSLPMFDRQSESTTPDEDLITSQQCSFEPRPVTFAVIDLKDPLLSNEEEEEERM